MQVKIFEHYESEKLEEKMNKWLSENNFCVTVKDIKFSSVGPSGICAMVIYSKRETLAMKK